MSRIGRMPVKVPQGVTVSHSGRTFSAKGPLGELAVELPREMGVAVEDGTVNVSRPSDSKRHRSLHGLTRTLINNVVLGVSQGYSKRLEIVGVGFRAQTQGKALVLNLGFSHPVTLDPPAGVTFETPEPTKIVIKGPDKQVVGQIAANIRELRPPEPYKGKGVKYEGETIRRKAGKTAAS